MVRLVSISSALVLVACGPSNVRNFNVPGDDSGTALDGGPSRDLRLPPDLAFSGSFFRYVLDRVSLPSMRGAYATDENGDGIADNAFSALTNAFIVKGFSFVQSAEDIA